MGGGAIWWKNWGGRENQRFKSQDALAHHAGKSSSPACTVEFPVYTQGARAPFPNFSSFCEGGQDHVTVKFRVLGNVFHCLSGQALTAGEVVCLETAAFNENDKYYAVMGFLRKIGVGGPFLQGMHIMLGKVHSALLGVHSTAA